jgi:hypothetical protein
MPTGQLRSKVTPIGRYLFLGNSLRCVDAEIEMSEAKL